MARGFGGETSAQEARGNENVSESQVAGGREDAASRAMAGGRDVDPGGRDGGFLSNDYVPDFQRVNQIQNQLQAKERFFRDMGITATNPYGNRGFFSRVLGFDPKNIDYTGNFGGRAGVAAIANKAWNRYSNWSGQDAQSQKRAFGSLFGNPVGELTAAGPVAQQVNLENVPIGDALAVQAASLALGPLGYGLMSMADPFSTYVPAGSKAYNEQFDPAINKDLPTSVMGQAASRTGLGISSLADSIKDYFSPRTPAPTPTQIGSVTPSQYETRADIIGRLGTVGAPVPSANIQRTSQHPLTGETSIVDGLNGFQTETLPDGSVRSVQTTGGMTEAEANAIKDSLSRNAGYNFYGDPDVEAAYPQASVETQQVAGSLFDSLFRDPMISPEAREILKEKGMTIDDLFAPKTPTPEPEKPDIMDLIQGATQTSALGGPATANQYAQVDYSNLRNVG